MINIIIVAVLAVIVVFAARRSVKHMKGESTCCGGGDTPVKHPPKRLDGAVIGERTVTIQGMHCENCAVRVTNAINRIDGASAKVNYKKGLASVSFDREIREEDLRQAVESQGYQVIEIA